jgi:hypothetical protein
MPPRILYSHHDSKVSNANLCSCLTCNVIRRLASGSGFDKGICRTNNLVGSEAPAAPDFGKCLFDLARIKVAFRESGRAVDDFLIPRNALLLTLPGFLIEPSGRTDDAGDNQSEKTQHGPTLHQKGPPADAAHTIHPARAP